MLLNYEIGLGIGWWKDRKRHTINEGTGSERVFPLLTYSPALCRCSRWPDTFLCLLSPLHHVEVWVGLLKGNNNKKKKKLEQNKKRKKEQKNKRKKEQKKKRKKEKRKRKKEKNSVLCPPVLKVERDFDALPSLHRSAKGSRCRPPQQPCTASLEYSHHNARRPFQAYLTN